MIQRQLNLPKKNSFFLFGARGTGKTHLLQAHFSEYALYIDLLDLDAEARYQLDPESLFRELESLPAGITRVIIDEIQKAPKLLDVVHRKIESSSLQFVLTGSSARKLKSGGANLLAGRAFVFHLFPLTAKEIGAQFNLTDALQYGTLPRVVTFVEALERRRFLKAYGQTYLKEEVWGEQLIRKIAPFRKFLQIAAQGHGQVVNYSRISKQVGVDDSTVSSYYSILEDTLLGFFLPAYSGSVRKQLRAAPKFYLFDNGVQRSLAGLVDFPISHGSFEYGILFEQFVIAEIMRRIAYLEIDLQFSYLSTEGGAEVDLVISRANRVVALVEIKSGSSILPHDLRHIKTFAESFKRSRAYCLYSGTVSLVQDGVHVLPWSNGVDAVVKQVTE